MRIDCFDDRDRDELYIVDKELRRNPRIRLVLPKYSSCFRTSPVVLPRFDLLHPPKVCFPPSESKSLEKALVATILSSHRMADVKQVQLVMLERVPSEAITKEVSAKKEFLSFETDTGRCCGLRYIGSRQSDHQLSHNTQQMLLTQYDDSDEHYFQLFLEIQPSNMYEGTTLRYVEKNR